MATWLGGSLGRTTQLKSRGSAQVRAVPHAEHRAMTTHSAPSRLRSRLLTGGIVLLALIGVLLIIFPGILWMGLFLVYMAFGGGQIG